MFIEALFIIARTWKQSKCPSVEEGTKKMYIYVYKYIYIYTHTHTMEYYSAIKRNDMVPFAATWIDLEIVTLSEVRKRKTNMLSLIGGI